jgi:hypothetical protein
VSAVLGRKRKSRFYLGHYLSRKGVSRECAEWIEGKVLRFLGSNFALRDFVSVLKNVDDAMLNPDRFNQLNQDILNIAGDNPVLADKYCTAILLSFVPCLQSKVPFAGETLSEYMAKELDSIYEKAGKLEKELNRPLPGTLLQFLHRLYLNIMFTTNVPLRVVAGLEAPYGSLLEALDRQIAWFVLKVAKELDRQYREGIVTRKDYEGAMMWASRPDEAKMTLGMYHKSAVTPTEKGVEVQFVDDLVERVEALERWLREKGIKTRRPAPTVLEFGVPEGLFGQVARMLVTLTSIDFYNDLYEQVVRSRSVEEAYRKKKEYFR